MPMEELGMQFAAVTKQMKAFLHLAPEKTTCSFAIVCCELFKVPTGNEWDENLVNTMR